MHFDRSGQKYASYVSGNTSSCDIITVYMCINSFHANQTVYNSVVYAFSRAMKMGPAVIFGCRFWAKFNEKLNSQREKKNSRRILQIVR